MELDEVAPMYIPAWTANLCMISEQREKLEVGYVGFGVVLDMIGPARGHIALATTSVSPNNDDLERVVLERLLVEHR